MFSSKLVAVVIFDSKNITNPLLLLHIWKALVETFPMIPYSYLMLPPDHHEIFAIKKYFMLD